MRGALAISVAVGCFAVTMTVRPSAAGQSACSLLTNDVVTQVSPASPASLKLMLMVKPMEDKVGAGTACSYGGITMQVDVVTPAGMEKVRDKTWVAVPGLGDTAYFHDNRGRFAELYVQAGKRTLTIQMSPAEGKTVADTKANTIALAKLVLPKLK
jgi:hypothetical protein